MMMTTRSLSCAIVVVVFIVEFVAAIWFPPPPPPPPQPQLLARDPMDDTPGAVGTTASLSLRLGQALFSSASLLFMTVGVEFYSYTAFCFLVTIMGLVIPWSCTLAMVDMYSIFVGCPLRLPGVVIIVVVGDWILSILSLAAACSTAGVIDLLLRIGSTYCSPKFCGRYQLSAGMAFLSWFLTAASSLFNLWLVAS
ncbi:CASP-like protein 5C1 [Ananas comosus]|uniref:CASP-like protein n=1 Tax=Ananas comosus TaxID=4615 RepID=A0A6P5FGW0_ANACO|nr:CASP-like protein 5C1 [Ananas comosus]